MVSFLKLSTLSILYFVQGAPYGFQSACLPIILRSQGLSYTALGILKLLFLPWVCKPFYAPLVDRTFNRKWWLQTVSILLLDSWTTNAIIQTFLYPDNFIGMNLMVRIFFVIYSTWKLNFKFLLQTTVTFK